MKLKLKHRYPQFILSIFILASLYSCERDDICAATTPTTPHLIIRFYDINAREETKTVRHMSIRAEENQNYIIYDRTVDSIILPLKVDMIDTINTTRFLLTKDVDFDTDENPGTLSNTDTLTVNYTPKLIYVSRACGYKSVFSGLTANPVADKLSWMVDVEIINDTINNEDAAHINIYH